MTFFDEAPTLTAVLVVAAVVGICAIGAAIRGFVILQRLDLSGTDDDALELHDPWNQP